MSLIMHHGGGRRARQDSPPVVSPPGAVYYFDSVAGDDSKSGTSPLAAWKSESKFNSTVFPPASTVCFKRGGWWPASLYLHSSGQTGAPIRLTAYGTGVLPRLGHVRADLAHGRADYNTLDNLLIDTGAGAGLEVHSAANNLTLRQLVVKDCALGQGLWLESSATGDLDGLLVEDVEVSGCKYQGLYLHSTDTHPIGGVVLRRIHSHGNGLAGSGNLDGIVCGNLQGGIVEACWSHDNGGDGIDLGGYSVDSVSRYHRAHNNTGSGIVISNYSQNCAAYGNLSYSNDVGLFFKNPTVGCMAYNNTLVYNATYGAMLKTTVSAKFKNNILVNHAYAQYQPSLFTEASVQTLECDYNVYLHPAFPNTQFYDFDNSTHYSLAEWQGLGYDLHSLNADPGLNVDYVPGADSVALGIGLDLGAAYRNLLDPRSIWPNAVWLKAQAALWDIGAFVV